MKRTNYRNDPRLIPGSLLREEPLLSLPADDDWEGDRMEEFLRYLRTIESEPSSTLARQLIADGIELPDPASFDESAVHPKLWEVIRGLARRRHFLDSTDHLSDLELYRHLWEITLNEPTHELDDTLGDCACHLDLVSDGSDESIWLWLRYYADEPTRRNWASDFPDEFIPDPCPLPYDRDQHLPQREFS